MRCSGWKKIFACLEMGSVLVKFLGVVIGFGGYLEFFKFGCCFLELPGIHFGFPLVRCRRKG